MNSSDGNRRTSDAATPARSKFALGVGVVVVLLIFAILNVRKPTDPPREFPDPIKLNLEVSNDGMTFVFVNKADHPITNVRAHLNGGFSVRVASQLDAFVGRATVRAMDFVQQDGTRFNPYAKKALAITVTADTPEGSGSWSGSWK